MVGAVNVNKFTLFLHQKSSIIFDVNRIEVSRFECGQYLVVHLDSESDELCQIYSTYT